MPPTTTTQPAGGVRYLVAAVGSAGDVHPFLALGRELRRRGNAVTVLANERFAGVTRAAGLDFVAVGDTATFDRVADDPEVWRGRRGAAVVFEQVAEHLREAVDALLPEARAGRTVLVGSSLALAARLVRDAAGVPLASVHLSPAVLRSRLRPPRLPGLPPLARAPRRLLDALWWLADRTTIDPLLVPALAAEAKRLGVAAPQRPLNGWWHSPDLVLGLFPAWFAPPPPDWPARLVLAGFPLFDEEGLHPEDPVLEEWLDAAAPPVVLTAGSANRHAAAFFRAGIAACARLGRRALLLTSTAANVPAVLPSSALHRAYVPFGRVFPRAAAVVHHGGIGTTAQALAAGVPQLVTPYAHDQPDNAARVVALGAGLTLPAGRHGPGRMARQLERLLADGRYAARAAELAPRLRAADAVGLACDAIEALAGRRVD